MVPHQSARKGLGQPLSSVRLFDMQRHERAVESCPTYVSRHSRNRPTDLPKKAHAIGVPSPNLTTVLGRESSVALEPATNQPCPSTPPEQKQPPQIQQKLTPALESPSSPAQHPHPPSSPHPSASPPPGPPSHQDHHPLPLIRPQEITTSHKTPTPLSQSPPTPPSSPSAPPSPTSFALPLRGATRRSPCLSRSSVRLSRGDWLPTRGSGGGGRG